MAKHKMLIIGILILFFLVCLVLIVIPRMTEKRITLIGDKWINAHNIDNFDYLFKHDAKVINRGNKEEYIHAKETFKKATIKWLQYEDIVLMTKTDNKAMFSAKCSAFIAGDDIIKTDDIVITAVKDSWIKWSIKEIKSDSDIFGYVYFGNPIK